VRAPARLALLPLVLLLSACGPADEEGRDADEALTGRGAQAARASFELPRVGTLGVCPAEPEAIVVRVERDGRVTVGGRGPLSLSALEDEVERQAEETGWKEEDGCSRKVLVLEADRALPWLISVWVVKAALAARPWPQAIYFAARAEANGARGAIGWRLPDGDQESSAKLPWTAAVLDLVEGEASAESCVLPYLRDARERADGTGETRFEVLSPRSGSPAVPTGFVLRVFDLALRVGVTDVCFEGARPPDGRPYGSVEWLLEKTAELAKEQGAPRIRVMGPAPPSRVATDEAPAASGLLPRRYGLDVGLEGAPGRALHRGRPSLRRMSREAGEAGLLWLAAHQAEDGGWFADAPDHDVAATGLALLAYLRHGYTNRGKHAFAKVLSRGLRHLKDRQREDGRFGSSAAPHALYAHAAATLAMAEAFDLTGSPIFKHSLQAGVDAIAALREPEGLWTDDSRDARLDVWMALPVVTVLTVNDEARRRGREPPLTLDEATLDAIRRWVDRRVAEPDETSSAVLGGAIRVGILLGERRSEDSALAKALERHGRLCPEAGSGAWDVAEIACGLDAFLPRHVVDGSWDGWGVWRPVALAVLACQRRDGSAEDLRGSWDPGGGEAFGGGRVVATALATRSPAPYGHFHLGTVRPPERFGD